MLRATAGRIDDALDALTDLPALWHSWPHRPAWNIEDELTARGFVFEEEEPLMTLRFPPAKNAQTDIGPAVAPAPARAAAVAGKKAPHPLESPLGPASIRLVDGEEALLAWEELWTGSASDPAVHAALAAAGLGTHRVAHHFVAEVDGSLVGCGAAVVARATVAVEHIVTAATHRRRGIGAQLTGAALAIGRDHGATTAILTASPDGAALYHRLGFVDREPVRRFVAPGR
ncbi:GNAT family N-acetyltransferase [Leucobacter komagatae]|uniref:N-acetyltransferase domain-containing protein n=1 Tax=Leucobacter komagatae TaxID=55969 RepID=A0A0D0H3A9_9MICO|nr:GNAT family N-acetyltransferase [Leucobacter komagatae]KIP51620.1 hypothetical protein SD72_14350 [Leucobacter komagatae]